MSDLVKRLRKIGSSDPVGYNTMTVAADRIEELEAHLRGVLGYPDLRKTIGSLLFDAASKALED